VHTDISELIRRLYVEDQLGSPTISKQVGLSARTINRHLHAMGIPVRSPSENTSIQYARAAPDERLAQVAAAHDAARGRMKSFDELQLAAFSRHERGIGIGPHELEFAALLRDADIPFDQQTVCGTYNLDFSIVGLPIAIEIVTKNWTGRNRSLIGLRQSYILERWNLVEIKFRKEYRVLYPTVMDTVLSAIADVRADPATLGRIWHMWPDGSEIRQRRSSHR
jgi:hypothetical protein